MYNLNYTPKTLGLQSWREIISGGTRTKKVEYHSFIQCGRILCEDAFLKTSHNSRQVFSWFRNTYVILGEFLGIRIILNFAHKVRLY
jgi:hypothetical protein